MRDETEEIKKQIKWLRNQLESGKQEWLDPAMRDRLARLEKVAFGTGRESLPKANRPQGHKNEELKFHGNYSGRGDLKTDAREPDMLVNHIRYSEQGLRIESNLRGISGGATAWKELQNCFQESVEVTVHKLVYEKVLHRQQKYQLKRDFNKFGKEVIITAPGPAKLRSGSRYSIEFAVDVAINKYGFHMPLERQRRQMEEAGLEIDVKTLYGLCETVAEHCKTVEERIRQDILSDYCAAHIDETPWPILGADSNGQMWALSNRVGSIYRFEPTRSGKIAEELVKDHEGAVLTDGFSGYNRLKKDPRLRLGACWAHARREFFERIEDFPEAAKAVGIIDELFAIEAKTSNFEKLRELRRTESRPTLEKLLSWMNEAERRHLPQSGVRKAINYTKKLWPELTRFAEDMRLPLSNNDAERALRHVVMGRKNFNGSKTINGADTAAAIYTVIESAKKVGLQPRSYLQYLIEARWNREQVKTPHEIAQAQLNPEQVHRMPEKHDWKI